MSPLSLNDFTFLILVFVGLPIFTYFMFKFGTAGFYSAKRMWDKSPKNINSKKTSKKRSSYE